MTRRALPTHAVALALTAMLVASCGGPPAPIQFANITLLVREPAGQERGQTDNTNVFFGLDGKKPPSLSFPKGTPSPLVTSPIDLGDADHVLSASISIGNDIDHPKALGRADDITLPAVSELNGKDFNATLPLIVARPNVAEALDDGVPFARRQTAACDDVAGRAWLVGGVDGAGNPVANAYAFTLDALKATTAFDLALSTPAACDGDDTGDVTTFEPTAGTLRFRASNANPQLVDVTPEPAATTAFVRTVASSVWAASDIRATLVSSDGSILVDQGLALRSGSVFAAIDERNLVRANVDGVDLITENGTTFTITSAAGAGFVAADPDGTALVRNQAGSLTLVTPQIDESGALDLSNARALSLDGVVPDEIQVIVISGAPRVVGLSRALGVVDVEGSAQTAPERSREHLAHTVGGAVLLFGVDAGHDVLIAP